MLKYVNTGVVFQEIPDEVTLAVNISNCPCRCPGCHSSYLWSDTGEPLTPEVLDSFVRDYGNDITCICFMGGDAEPEEVDVLHAIYITTIRKQKWAGTPAVCGYLPRCAKVISII